MQSPEAIVTGGKAGQGKVGRTTIASSRKRGIMEGERNSHSHMCCLERPILVAIWSQGMKTDVKEI